MTDHTILVASSSEEYDDYLLIYGSTLKNASYRPATVRHTQGLRPTRVFITESASKNEDVIHALQQMMSLSRELGEDRYPPVLSLTEPMRELLTYIKKERDV